MHLSLRQLSTFREVMRSGSISQAARAMGRTQPAISTMMQTLEGQLGFALFIRSQGKLSPTPEAHFFLEECEDILARVERTERTIQGISTLQSGRLQVACHPAASSVFLPKIMTEFIAGRSELQVSLIMRSSDMIEDLIASQQFNVGFSETPSKPRAAIHQINYNLECVCVLPSNDPLTNLSVITPKELNGRAMAVLFDQHTTAIQTEDAFRQMGYHFNKKVELRTFLPGLQFVESGLCVMVCDMITAYSYMLQTANQPASERRITFRRFEPKISNNVSILTPGYATQSLAAAQFIIEIQTAVEVMTRSIEKAISTQ